MSELEPDSQPSQWLWFGAVLLAMTVIVLVMTYPRESPCALAQVEEGCSFLGASFMNKSALALAGFGFAAGIVLIIVVEPLLHWEPKATSK